MLKKPIVSKIRVNNPNLYNSRVKNRNHLVYIGTRDGVDISEPLLEEEIPSEEASNELYLKYINERPNSHGLFGNIDVSDIVKLGNHLANETANGKCIYRGILSVSEEDALELGYDQKKKWMELIPRIMPYIAEEFNIPASHLQYCAAIHKEQRHPHCHYMFWDDRNGKIQSPYIHTSKQNRIREKISGIINEESIRQDILNKTLQRDLILDLNREMLENEFNSIIANQDKISGRIRAKDIDTIAYKILKLTEVLPEHGRIVYQYMPKEVKQKIDLLVDDVLKIPAIKKEYDKYIEYVNNLSKGYSASEKHTDYTEDKNIADIRKRIANQILKTCDKARSISDIIDKVTDEVDLTGLEEPNVEDEFVFSDYDISENDDNIKNTDFEMEWNKEYKAAIKKLYDPNIENIEHILNTLEKQAFNGNVLAMHELGKIYDKGIKVEKNPDIAAKYYADAFKGFQYLTNIPSEKPKKTEWKKSYCNYRLGTMYYDGKGVEKDTEKAFDCFSRSAKMNNPNALYAMGKYYSDKTMHYYDPEQAEIYFKAAIHEGNDYAYTALAYLYMDETSSIYDLDKGVKILQKISDENISAKYTLGKIYITKDLPYFNVTKGIDLLQECISEGNANAMYQLGKLYTDRTGELYDIRKGIHYLELAAQKENSYAMIKLGNIYLWGKHEPDINRNEELGLKYLNDAMEHGNDCAKDMINFYENYKTNMMPSLSYSMLQSINKFFYYSRANTYQHENLKQYARRSKEYLREQAEKNKNGAEI